MSFLQRLFGRQSSAKRGSSKAQHSQPGPQSQFASSTLASRSPGSVNSVRRETLRVVVRETLVRNGIPIPWIGADALVATSPKREPGLHVRLLFKHWDPRLVVHSMAFQQDMERRLVAMDPTAADWLMGVSWQFALPDGNVCPPLPSYDSWADEAPTSGMAAMSVMISGDPSVAPATPASTEEADPRSDLEKLFAVRDADLQRHAEESGNSFAATEPARL